MGSLFECVLGVSLIKGGYWVFNTGNREASVAFTSSSPNTNSSSKARARVRVGVSGNTRRGRVVGVPKGGVRMLKL